MRISSSLFAHFLILIMLSPTANAQFSPTADLSTTWTINYSWNDDQPMLLSKANGSVFTCRFFNFGDYKYIFAIIISPTSYSDTGVVWSANRDNPVSDTAILNFTAAGELVLRDGDGSIVWTTNTAGKSVKGMNLTDTGNLVLFDDHNSVVWQSFDHPTDSLLPGQKLFTGQKLTSAVSKYNSSSGMYSLQVTNKGVFGYVESTPPQVYYSMFVYNNHTNKGRSYISLLNGSLSLFIHSSEPSHPDAVIDIPQASSSARFMKLMPDGHLKLFKLQSEEVTDLTAVFGAYSTAKLSTTWNTNYSHDQPMLLIETKRTQFSCGFLCEKDATGNKPFYCIFAIFIYPATNSNEFRVIWSANRDNPVGEKAILNFTAAGELVLKNEDGSIVWTTNTAGKSVAGMNMTDTGNLVLFDDKNSVVWQSFDHPTDSVLPGQKLSEGQKLKASVSDTNSSAGMYFLQVTEDGTLSAYADSNPPQLYYKAWVGRNYKIMGRWHMRLLNGSLSFFIEIPQGYIDIPKPAPQGYIDIPRASSAAQYMKLMPDGHLQLFEWQSTSKKWTVVKDFTKDANVGECGYPLACGRNSICTNNQQCLCPIREHFRPVNDGQPELGCSEITPLTCNSTQDQHFITLENVKYFTSTAHMAGVNVETCKQACLKKCSCKAVFFRYHPNASNGECYLPSELFTMQALDNINASAFIKVKNDTSPPLPHQVATVGGSTNRASRQVARVVGSTIGSFVLLFVVVIGFIRYVVHKRKTDAEIEEDYLDQMPGMPTRFSYEDLKTATEKFSKKLGQGGFGSVFEGTLKDGSMIAVKCLEGLTHIKKSFLAEVQSIGSIHHVNLVRLRGFCTWKSQRFLVYDFMSNGSLDRWIYHGVRKQILDWECRKKVILDIAKGLVYLHEECRQKIVHLDIKPQNILLDNDFNAKVSDFGLSKLIDKSQAEVITSIKGTPGYIAPEWRSSVITEKLDVYSFGIVILEILCGRKIFDRSLPEESWYLLSVFQNCWEKNTLLDMIDRHSEDMQVHTAEVVEMMKLAAWCLQTNFKRRPSMSSVVKVLEGGMNVESNLNYNFTDPSIQEPEVGDESNFTLLSSSLLSGPR